MVVYNCLRPIKSKVNMITEIKNDKKYKYKYSHLGKSFKTYFEYEYDEDIVEKVKKYLVPDISKKIVELHLYKSRNGPYKQNYINHHYFTKLMNDSVMTGVRYSINEMMQSDDIIGYFVAKMKVYKYYNLDLDPNPNDPKMLIPNFWKTVRLHGGSISQKLSNYPYKQAKDIIKKYNINGKYYDYSCGWGIRCLASMNSNVEYYGTDPNYKLTAKIKEMVQDYNKANNTDVIAKIYTQGSEKFIPELENKMGLAFTSPPYFDLEDYKFGDQSIQDKDYNQWLELYWRPTVKNIKLYLIKEGYFLLNVKNMKKYKLLDDMEKIAEEEGFQLTGYEDLQVSQRFTKEENSDEKIAVFEHIGYNRINEIDEEW